MVFGRAPRVPEGEAEREPRRVAEGGRSRSRTAGASYTEKALLAKQLEATEELLDAQRETNRLLTELLAQGRPPMAGPPVPGRHGPGR